MEEQVIVGVNIVVLVPVAVEQTDPLSETKREIAPNSQILGALRNYEPFRGPPGATEAARKR